MKMDISIIYKTWKQDRQYTKDIESGVAKLANAGDKYE